MRNLMGKDFGPFSKWYYKMELSPDIKAIIANFMSPTEGDKGPIYAETLASVFLVIIENYWKAEEELFILLSNITGKSVDEIGELPADEFIGLIKSLVSDPGFFGFLKQLPS